MHFWTETKLSYFGVKRFNVMLEWAGKTPTLYLDKRYTGFHHTYRNVIQTRREPQWGPGKHYHGALWSPHSVCLEIETWGEVSPHHPTMGSGSVVSSSSGFYGYFRSRKNHLELHFQYFWAMAGPPKRRGARENLPPFRPLSTGLMLSDWDECFKLGWKGHQSSRSWWKNIWWEQQHFGGGSITRHLSTS